MRKVFAATLIAGVAVTGMPVGVLAVAPATRAAGQGPQSPGTGVLQGVARNAQQKNLPSVRIQVRGADGQVVVTGTTNAAGEFSFASLDAATYTVEIVNVAGEIVGTASITVAAGTTTAVTLTATAAGTIAAAAGGGAGLLGLGTLGTVAVVGAAGSAAIVAVTATKSDASPSR